MLTLQTLLNQALVSVSRKYWNDTGDEYSVTSKQYVVFNPENVKPA